MSIQDGGHNSNDQKFKGLGRTKFLSCRTVGDETKPQQEFKVDVSDDGRKQLGRIQIDKTTTIQNFVDFIGAYVTHPKRPAEDEWKRTQFIIPYKNDWETDFILKDAVSITRKDLSDDPDIAKEDPRQRVRKEFNHPPDSIMSIIYCLVADKNYDVDQFKLLGTGRAKKRP